MYVIKTIYIRFRHNKHPQIWWCSLHHYNLRTASRGVTAPVSYPPMVSISWLYLLPLPFPLHSLTSIFCLYHLLPPVTSSYLPLPSTSHTTHSAYRVVVQVVHEPAGQRSLQVATSNVRDGSAGLQAFVQLRRNDAQAPVVAGVVVHNQLAHDCDAGRQHQEQHGRAAITK